MAPPRKRQRLAQIEDSNAEAHVASLPQEEDEEVATTTANTTPPEKGERAPPGRSLFVRGLASSVTSESLAELFSETFPVKHAVAVNDPETKQCRGYGFVTFADAEDAERAKAELEGKLHQGKKLRIEIAEARDREEKSTAKSEAKAKRELERAQEQQAPRLIVRNMPWTIKKDTQLAALFNKYGKVKQAYIPKRSGGLLPGFGFVVMRSRKHAEKAIQGENGKEIDGRTIAVDWAVQKEVYQKLKQDGVEPDAQQEPTYEDEASLHDSDAAAVDDEDEDAVDDENSDEDEDLESDGEDEDEDDLEANKMEDRSATLFVRNLPFTCTDEDLEDQFGAFGKVRYARIVLDPATDRPKGTGFVAFRSKDDAEACLHEAPSRIQPPQPFQERTDEKPQSQPTTILQNPDTDPTGRYTMEGRVLQLSRAVDKTEAKRLTEQSLAMRNQRNADKRRLYLLSEGTIASNTQLWQSLPPSEQTMRSSSMKQRKKLIESNPSLHLSLTRLSVRNIPRTVGSKDLKALAREAIVGFATDVKGGKRQKLSVEELHRGGEDMLARERARREAGKGVVKQAKVVFENEGGSKVDEASGAGRSRGYGFIEFHTHRNALMALRWLNGHSIGYQVKDPQAKLDREALQDRKKRLIVEFAIENAQVVRRRGDREQRANHRPKTSATGSTVNGAARDASSHGSQKRKRIDDRSATASGPVNKGGKPAMDEKIAQRNRIIGRKRAMRREKRGQK